MAPKIDFTQSEAQGRIVVCSKVNPDLDRVRQQYHGLPDFLSQIAHRIADGVSNPHIRRINAVYMPQLGFLVTVPLPETGGAETLHQDGFDLQFTTAKMAYFKEPLTQALDEEIGDVYADMIDQEVEVVRVLVQRLAPYQCLVMHYGRWASEMDCLQSLADLAVENHLVRPELTDGLELTIRNGR